MLAHVGLRPLWPVLLFAPWALVGLACLMQSMRRPRGDALQTAH